MKLKLLSHKNIPVLAVTEDVPRQQAAVLRVGLKNLLRTGKSEIILDLSGVTAIASEALSEIVNFYAIAAELAGKIVLVSTAPRILEIVAKEANQALLPVAPSIEGAFRLITAGQANGSEEDTDAARMMRQKEKFLEADVAQLTGNIKALETKIAGLSIAEFRRLRLEKRTLERRIKLLEGRLEKNPARRTRPAEAAVAMSKLNALEDAVFSLLKGRIGWK